MSYGSMFEVGDWCPWIYLGYCKLEAVLMVGWFLRLTCFACTNLLMHRAGTQTEEWVLGSELGLDNSLGARLVLAVGSTIMECIVPDTFAVIPNRKAP